MIYLYDDSLEILIPKHEEYLELPFLLSLVNNFTQQIYLYNIEEKVSLSAYFYKINIVDMDFSDLVTGEYTYELKYNDDVYERGLLTYNKDEQN